MTPEKLRERVEQRISESRGSGSHSRYIAEDVLRVVAEALTDHKLAPSGEFTHWWYTIFPDGSLLAPWLPKP